MKGKAILRYSVLATVILFLILLIFVYKPSNISEVNNLEDGKEKDAITITNDEEDNDNTLDNNEISKGDDSSIETLKKFKVKDMKSIDDITDEMIKLGSVGYNVTGYSSNYSDKRFNMSFVSFSGCDYSKLIHTDNDMEVNISYKTNIDRESLKISFMIEDELIDIPLDESKVKLTLPKGDTLIAITGYKAKGDVEMNMETEAGAIFKQNVNFE